MTQSQFRPISAVLLFLTLFSAFAQAADKVVVIPLNSNKQGSPDKLWGDGRPNATTLAHDTGTKLSHCTTQAGINFALSSSIATWESAQTVCPANSWVCSIDEIGSTACPIRIENSYNHMECTGATFPSTSTTITNPYGWLADIYDGDTTVLFDDQRIKSANDNTSTLAYSMACRRARVWCCWK